MPPSQTVLCLLSGPPPTDTQIPLGTIGTVVSCVRKHDGNKPNGAQYAFIKYTCPQEAQYAINAGEVDIQGHRVLVALIRQVLRNVPANGRGLV